MQNLGTSSRQALQRAALKSYDDDNLDQAARTLMYETFPMLLLLSEFRSTIYTQQQQTSGAPSASSKATTMKTLHTFQPIQQKKEILNVHFQDLYASFSSQEVSEERYHRLKSELHKFDDSRFATLVNYISGKSIAPDQRSYFDNLYSLLRASAAIECRGEWMIIMRMLVRICQECSSQIFPDEQPSPSARSHGASQTHHGQQSPFYVSAHRFRALTKMKLMRADHPKGNPLAL